MRYVPLLVIVALGVLLLAGRGTADPAPHQAPRGARDPLDQRYRGFVRPSHQVELATPLEELLASVEVEEGQRVGKGDLLARLDDGIQAAIVDGAKVRAESRAEIEIAALTLQDATHDLERLTTAYEKEAATETELLEAQILKSQSEANHTAARENHKLAVVNLRLETERLSRYEVRAPFDGTIVRIIAEAGGMLRETDKIIEIAQLDPLEAQLYLPVELYGELRLGEAYTLLAQQPINRELTARLKMISPIIDTASGTFRCTFEIDNPDSRLPAGFTVYLKR